MKIFSKYPKCSTDLCRNPFEERRGKSWKEKVEDSFLVEEVRQFMFLKLLHQEKLKLEFSLIFTKCFARKAIEISQ